RTSSSRTCRGMADRPGHAACTGRRRAETPLTGHVPRLSSRPWPTCGRWATRWRWPSALPRRWPTWRGSSRRSCPAGPTGSGPCGSRTRAATADRRLRRPVAADLRVLIGHCSADEAAEPLERGIRDPVAGEEAVSPARDEALPEKEGQVLARVGLGRPGRVTQLLNRALAVEQGLEERQPGRV